MRCHGAPARIAARTSQQADPRRMGARGGRDGPPLYPVYGWIRDLVGVSRPTRSGTRSRSSTGRSGSASTTSGRSRGGSSRPGGSSASGTSSTAASTSPRRWSRSVALYHFDPGRYVRWRNTFLLMLVVALVGFWFYPLMPPRLLPSAFGFVDTRLTYFTIGKPVPHSQETGNLVLGHAELAHRLGDVGGLRAVAVGAPVLGARAAGVVPRADDLRHGRDRRTTSSSTPSAGGWCWPSRTRSPDGATGGRGDGRSGHPSALR